MIRVAGIGLLNSSHGEVHFDIKTGEVLVVEEDCCEECRLNVPIHVEVDEWKRTYPGCVGSLDRADGYDILDFDVWVMVEDVTGEIERIDGRMLTPVLEPHEDEHREVVREGLGHRGCDR